MFQDLQVLVSLSGGAVHVEGRIRRGTTVKRSDLQAYADGNHHSLKVHVQLYGLMIKRLLRLVGRWVRKPVNHTSWVAVVTPTDRPKSVRNRCLIELFCGVICVVTLPFWHFCWCRGFCHRTESDLFPFLLCWCCNEPAITKRRYSIVNISATTAYFCFGCLVFCKRSIGFVIALLPSPTVLKGIVVAVCNHQRMSVFQHKFIFLLSTILQLTFETDRIAVRIDNGTDQLLPESSTQEISKSIDDGIFLGGLGVKSQLVTGKTKLRYFCFKFLINKALKA